MQSCMTDNCPIQAVAYFYFPHSYIFTPYSTFSEAESKLLVLFQYNVHESLLYTQEEVFGS